MVYILTDSFQVSTPLDETWNFFSRAENLPDITPPWLDFTIRTPRPIDIREDARLDYTIRWLGIPIHWRTRIIDWTPPRQFIDLQIAGPYTLWHHQHTFRRARNGGTRCHDRVHYRLPGGWLVAPVHALVVRRQLAEIFRFRRRAIAERLGWVRALQPDVRIRRV